MFGLKRKPTQGCDDRIAKYRELGINIGEGCEIYENVSFGSEPYLISIGNHVRITKNVTFATHDGGVWVLRELYDEPNLDIFGRIIIGNNVHIGMGATILPGVCIGNNSVIGCGSIVTKDVPDGEVWAGIPTRFIETIDEYYKKNEKYFIMSKHLGANEKKALLNDMVEKKDDRLKNVF